MTQKYKEANLQILTEYFESGCKSGDVIGYGLEAEHFIIRKKDRTSVSYYGPDGVEEILHEMNGCICGTKVMYGEHQLGIICPDYNVTIEPAAQMEISIRPCKDIVTMESIYNSFRRRVDAILEKKDLEMVSMGYHPVSCVEDLPLIPKKRYEYMDAYFKTSGTRGINMMRGTASTQISIDYHSEEDFVRKFRLAYILSPIVKLLTDNTPYFEGKPADRPLQRSWIWEDVDKKRTGAIPGMEKPDFGFRAYAEYLWNVPLILRTDGDESICTGDKTVGEVYGNEIITRADAEHIISMVFPDVRLKKFVEIRMADGMDTPNMMAYAAFIKGIFGSRKMIRMLTDRFSADPEVIREAELSVLHKGFEGTIYGYPAKKLVLDMLEQAAVNLNHGEKMYLKPFFDRVHAGITLAEEALIRDGYENTIRRHINCVTGKEAGACMDEESVSEDKGIMVTRLWKDWLEEHPAEAEQWAENAEEYLKNCPEVNHGRYLHQLAIPKIYSKETIEEFKKISEETYVLLCHVTQRYLEDPEYRKCFPYSKELEEWILVPRGYDTMIPMARYDMFYNEETGAYKFCEINTDGTSAMNEDVECFRTTLEDPAYQKFSQEYRMHTFELFDSWVRAFADTYASYVHKKENPHVAILDFMEEACSYEFTIFRDRFRAAGFDTEIYEIRELTYEDGKLLAPNGRQIDAVYRRAVTGDVEKYKEQVQPFLAAVRDEAVCLVGAFCTQVVHHKCIFKVLHEPATMAFLSEKERVWVKAHIPATYDLTPQIVEKYEIAEHKDAWIIKPYDSYGSRGVAAGCDVTEEEWKKLLAECADAGFIVQEYCLPYKTQNRYIPGDADMKLYNNMPGLYVYNGKFAGIYSRYSDGGIISSVTNKRVTATMWVE